MNYRVDNQEGLSLSDALLEALTHPSNAVYQRDRRVALLNTGRTQMVPTLAATDSERKTIEQRLRLV